MNIFFENSKGICRFFHKKNLCNILPIKVTSILLVIIKL